MTNSLLSTNPIPIPSEDEELKIDYDYSSKVIVVGDQNSGKTSLIQKALNPENKTDEYVPTLGFEHFNLIVKQNGKKIKMTIWDTCGQEVYRAIVSSFYRGADVALLIFSLANKNSFENLKKWLYDLRENLNPGTPIMLIGTKLDLVKEVDNDEINSFLESNNLTNLYFTTTKNDSCNLVFKEAAKQLLNIFEAQRPSISVRESLKVTKTSFKAKKKATC